MTKRNTGKPTAPRSGGTETKAEGVGMDAFFTSDKAQEGVRMPLNDPLGRRTEHWLHIIGADSDEFRLADSAAKRRAVELGSISDEKERDKAVMELTRNLTATLVKGWSFPEECTHANVVEFFKKAPQIERAVNIAAVNRSLFYKVESKS